MSLDTKKDFDILTANYPLGTKWLRFHANVRLFAGGILSILYSISSLAALVSGDVHEKIIFLGYIETLLTTAISVLCLCAISPTRRLEPKAYMLNILISTMSISRCIVSITGFIILALVSFAEWDNETRSLVYTYPYAMDSLAQIVIFATSIGFETLHLIYMMKRRDLFGTPCVSQVQERVLSERPNADIQSLEKTYAQLDKFHDYYVRGIMTEEEYNAVKKKVLQSNQDKSELPSCVQPERDCGPLSPTPVTETQKPTGEIPEGGKTAVRIDCIYCFDYTKEIGHYDSIRNFSSEKMTYIGLALSTPKVCVNAAPYSFDVSVDGSNHIREYAIPQMESLREISEELAVNSPKYILICYFDGSKRYFAYNEQFFSMFKIVMQYKPQPRAAETSESPYALQKNEATALSSYTQPQRPPTQAAPTNTPSRTYSGQSLSQHHVQTEETAAFPWWKLLLIIGAVIAIVVVASELTRGANADVDTDAKSSGAYVELTPVAEPASGTILSGMRYHNGSEITVKAAGGESCVVKLKTRSGTERMSFYVRAGDTVTVTVPDEYLYVYFAAGDTWYGETHLFGEGTSYSMDEKIRDFTEYTWTYTLYPVNNGNFSETPIDAEDF